MPYEKGKVEGGPFYLQWTLTIFKVNIQVWYSITKTIANFYSSHSKCNQTYNTIYFETNTFHIHYEPLLVEGNDHIYNVQYIETPMDQTKTIISIVID